MLKSSDTPHYENVPFEVPDGWVWCKLGDVMSIKSGDNIKVRNNRKGEYPIYGGNGINGYYNEHNVESDTLVIGRVGFYCGSIHQTVSKAWVTDNAFIVSYENVFCSRYLYHLLKWLQLNKTSNSTAQPVISGKGIYPLLIPLPPIEEQKRIIAEIERWFAFIDQIEQGKTNLQATIAQTKCKILDLAIHGKLVPQDTNDEPASELLKRINPKAEITCDNGQYGKVPNGWCICHIEDVAESLLGKTLDKNKDTGEPKNYLCSINVQWDNFDLSTIKQCKIEQKDLERYTIRKGDLLVCEGGDVGRAAIWSLDKEMYYQNALHRIRFKGGISSRYFLYSFMFYKQCGVLDDISKGVTIKHFTQRTMNKISFPLPPLPEQHRIVDAIDKAFAKLDSIMESL